MSHIVLLGASGFLGAHIASAMIEHPGVSRLTRLGRDRCDLVAATVDDIRAVLRDLRPDVVVNGTGRLDGTTTELVQANTLATAKLLDALAAARDAGLVDRADAAAMAAGWTLAAQVRNALMLIRGRAGDQLPRHGPELAGVVRLLGGQDPGEFLDHYLRTGRRCRAAAERVLNG